tara:strand:- start:41 stop:469 length:429 start_codon:yes stop_codon:yes gene_type:complete
MSIIMVDCASFRCQNKINESNYGNLIELCPNIFSIDNQCLIGDEAFDFTPEVFQQILEHDEYEDDMTLTRYLWELAGGGGTQVVVFRTENLVWNIVEAANAETGNGTRVGMVFRGEKIVRVLSEYYLPICATCRIELLQLMQ